MRPGVSRRKKISLSERYRVMFRVLCEEEKAAIATFVSERKEKHSSRKASEYPPSEKQPRGLQNRLANYPLFTLSYLVGLFLSPMVERQTLK